jgi:hypothetical protein
MLTWRVVTRKLLGGEAAERWKAGHTKNGTLEEGSIAKKTYEKLLTLNGDPDVIDLIVGRSWTRLICDGCDTRKLRGVRITVEDDAPDTTLCDACLEAMLETLRQFPADK